MEEFAFMQPLLLTIAGLIIGAILKSILRNSRFPYTVGLFGIGLLTGILNRADIFESMPQLTEALNSVAEINPDLILYLFLPVLIFDAAYELNMHIFRKTLANATLLAAPGLVICMMLTGLLMVSIGIFIPGYESWTWTFALMFGALISATDPVAVVALLHELKTSKRFSTLVDAESLLNDGTGIVCFMLFFGVYAATGSTESSPVVEFIKVVSISTVLGYFIARFVIWFITRVNSEEMIQNSVIIISAYVTFIVSQFYLGVSGVIALVAFGLTVTYVGKPRLKPQVNRFMEHFWDLATYIANTLIFIIVGLVIAEKVTFSWGQFGVLIIIYVFLNLFRFAMISLLYPIMKKMGYGLTKRESVILTWGGLRGALAMTLALMVSYTESIPLEIRNHILFFTAGIVTLTLSINATTMRWLLNKMGLISTSSARVQLEYKVHQYIRESSEKYFEKIKAREQLKNANWKKVEYYMFHKPVEPFASPNEKDTKSILRLRVLDKEKATCKSIYEEGIISESAFRRLMNSLDELYDHDGKFSLDYRHSIFDFCSKSSTINALRKNRILHDWISYYLKERIAVVYDLGRGFIILQKENMKLVEELISSEITDEDQKSVLALLKKEIENNITRMDEVIHDLAQEYPKAYGHALTLKSIRMLLSNEKRTVRQMINNGIITEKDAESLLENIDERADEVNSFSHTIPASILRWIFFMKKREGWK